MNATEQASAAVKNLLGAAREFRPIPFMWSDQHDIKLQSYGIFPADGSSRSRATCRQASLSRSATAADAWSVRSAGTRPARCAQSRARLAEAMQGVGIEDLPLAAKGSVAITAA